MTQSKDIREQTEFNEVEYTLAHFVPKKDLARALQAIKSLLVSARIDELLYLTNQADPLILDRKWIASRIKELSSE